MGQETYLYPEQFERAQAASYQLFSNRPWDMIFKDTDSKKRLGSPLIPKNHLQGVVPFYFITVAPFWVDIHHVAGRLCHEQ